MQKKRWTILPDHKEAADKLRESLKVNPIICSILAQRNILTYEEAKAFFRPSLNQLHDPFLMKDMDKAVERVHSAIVQGEKILVFGDYDVDGTTAVASMYSFLQRIGNAPLIDFYIPNRYKEGYGLSKAGIDYAYENDVSLMITLDCGIKSVELVDYANSLNIDVVICDHHLPDSTLPKAIAILNPKQADCTYPFKELCGCGVGFKLISALCKKFHISYDEANKFMDLVATAIAADIVPIVDENRVIAYFGLEKINSNPSIGIEALIELSGARPPMDISNVVFMIAPRVNAAGRMDDGSKAVRLFVEQDREMAMEYAKMLHSDNFNRKETDKSITLEALDIINNDDSLKSKKTSVVYKEHWHKGVVGIVASRLIESYYRPTIVLTRNGNFLTGSARSVPGFNLYEAIYACREYLSAYGGHFAAAGLSLPSENLSAFMEKFEQVVSDTIEEKYLTPEIVIDAALPFQAITPGFYKIIKQMEPFGPQNMRPVFITRNVVDTGYSKVVKELHLRVIVKDEQGKVLTGIAFQKSHLYPILQSGKPVDIVYSLDENIWQGQTTIQLKIEDICLSDEYEKN